MIAALAGCEGALPEKVALSPEASSVEIIHDQPNDEAYESAGEVNAQTIGRDLGEVRRQAENAVRNEAGAKGATFVMIGDVTARSASDLSGRIVVSASGTAFRVK
ncbi:MAG: hypothetical protein FWD69_16840 [Polyangiaceae bacterium]|nr:hypothetical protein [Polyangiaceae bacterium]